MPRLMSAEDAERLSARNRLQRFKFYGAKRDDHILAVGKKRARENITHVFGGEMTAPPAAIT